MTLTNLMQALAARNVKLGLENGELSLKASKGALTQELLQHVRERKQEIIESLSTFTYQDDASDVEVVPDPAGRQDEFPFSDLQVGFYMASDPYMDYHVAPHYYNEFDKSGLDVQRYELAINKVLQRHAGEAVLVASDGVLRTLPEIPYIKIPVVNLAGQSSIERTAYLESVRKKMMREELPLDQWPWFDLRISVWEENGLDRARVHCNFNNFYSDGFGVSVFQREVEAFYQDPSLELPPLTLAYRDAVLGLAALSKSAKGERAKQYWLSRLPELPEPPAIPMVSGVNKKCRSRLNRREGFLDARRWSAIKQTGKEFGLTPSSIVIAAYGEILAIWSGSNHFILSNMVTRRLPIHPEIRSIFGNFASLYPLEVDLRGDLTFAQKVQRLQKQILTDSDHRQWGGMQVMQAFNQLKGEFGSVPCPFVVGSALFMEGYRKADFSCLETAQTVFDHQFWEQEDGSFYYVWDLLEEFFPSGMVDQMWRSYCALLDLLAEGKSNWQLKFFDILPQSLATAENATRHDENTVTSPQGSELLHDGFVRNALARPSCLAIELPSGNYSYGEIFALSDALYGCISDLNLPPNQLIAVLMERGAHLAAASLAILRSGHAYVPIDPAYPTDRVDYLIKNSRSKLVITQDRYQSRLASQADFKVFVVEDIIAKTILAKNVIDGAPKHPAKISASDLAYVIYTSGSTGQPKGVMIEHAGALNTVRDINRRFAIGAGDKIFGVSSFSFDLSVYDLFGTFEAGAALVYPDPEQALNPAHWLELLTTKRITVWNSAPPLMTLLVESAERQSASLPDLRIVMLSGDWIPVELPDRIRRIAPNATLISLGGATEASIWSIYYQIDAVDPRWTSIPYGKALSGQGWQIRDTLGRRVPVWVTGELFITGCGLARGYWEDEEKSSRSFITDPTTGERLYRTGDLGRYLPDGNIEFIGRIDTQVKIQGHRIELGEIESAISRCPSVKDAVVLALPANSSSANASGKTSTTGKSNRVLVAYIAPRDENVLVSAEAGFLESIRSQLKKTLPIYMMPAGWCLLSEMPITSNGKIDRTALAKIDHTLSGQAEKNSTGCRVEPKNALERDLAMIWAKVLNMSEVSVTADFFEIGGRSFDAVRCISLIKEVTGYGLTLGDMWEFRTIRNLAERLVNADNSTIRVRKINTADTGMSIFMVHPGGGQIIGYYGLAGMLECPVYAAFATAEDARTGDLASIESIAARYIRQIRSVMENTPAVILGWSSGACIAFEIAAQLERAGDSVAQVIVVDAPAPLQHRPLSRLEMLKGFFEDLALDLPVIEIEKLNLNLEGEDIASQFSRITTFYNQLLKNRFQADQDFLDANELFGIYEVFHACVTAIRRYHAKPIAAGITVVRASDSGVSEFSDYPYANQPHWGWADFSRSEITTRCLTGTHHTLLQSPTVGEIAAIVDCTVKAASIDEDKKSQRAKTPVPV